MRPHILLTNDDSHRSPLLELAIELLGEIGDLTIVVPREEQSWRGKSMSRFGYLHCEDITLFGFPAVAVGGTPADCVNLGIHHIAKRPVTIVISGINAGINAGTSFILSSGTVGACLEGNIAGVPGIALSQEFKTEWWQTYTSSYQIAPAVLQHIKQQICSVLPGVIVKCIDQSRVAPRSITWNINLPHKLACNWKIVGASPALTCYGSFFAGSASRYTGGNVSVRRIDGNTGDIDVLARGDVPISILDVHELGRMSSSKADEITDCFSGTDR